MPLLVTIEAQSFRHVLCPIHVHRLSMLPVIGGRNRMPFPRSRFPTRGVGLGGYGGRRCTGVGLSATGVGLRSPRWFLVTDPMGLVVDPILLLFLIHLQDALLPSCIADRNTEPDARDQAGIVLGNPLPYRTDHRASRSGVVQEGGQLSLSLYPLEEVYGRPRHF